MQLEPTIDTNLEDGTGNGADDPSGPDNVPGEEILVDDDLLVEEISIDGMCGVY